MANIENLLKWFGTSISEDDFADFYQTELPRVYNFFRYLLGDSLIAEDLTSATFEKAWRNRTRYRYDLSALSTWLFTIARRVALDYFRKHHNEISLDVITNHPDGAMLEEVVEQKADIIHLSNLLARLADRERELVALKYGAGLTNRAIAQLTGLSESNVGVILFRTINFLHSNWEGTP